MTLRHWWGAKQRRPSVCVCVGDGQYHAANLAPSNAEIIFGARYQEPWTSKAARERRHHQQDGTAQLAPRTTMQLQSYKSQPTWERAQQQRHGEKRSAVAGGVWPREATIHKAPPSSAHCRNAKERGMHDAGVQEQWTRNSTSLAQVSEGNSQIHETASLRTWSCQGATVVTESFRKH